MRIVVVLGMHRSGTSLCTRVLNRLGVALSDDLLPPAPDNEEGFFESARILELHQEILVAIGTGAADSLTLRPRPPQWWAMPALAAAKAGLRDFILAQSADRSRLWGFKDPRSTVLLPLWQDVFVAAGVRPIYLLTVRRPWEVAASLRKRNRISEGLSELLWLEHYLEAIRYVGADIATVVVYDRWFVAPLEQGRAIAAAIGCVATSGGAGSNAALASVVREIINPDLRHHTDSQGTFLYDVTRVFYDWLDRGDLSGAAGMIARVEAELPSIARQVTKQQQPAVASKDN